MYKAGTTTKMDPSHIYIVGFWSSGNSPFVIDSVFPSNSSEYDALFKNLILTGLETEGDTLNFLTGSSSSLTVKAVYADGHKADVSTTATYTNPSPGIVQITNGQAIAKENGEVTITVSFKDVFGNLVSKDVHIKTSTFPLVSKLLNPSISGQGTFDETTHTLVTGQSGFGGWSYTNGVNLSGYKYLVARLGSDNNSNISFKVFDENSYSTKAAECDFGNTRQAVVNLSNVYKKGTTTKLNPSHMYIVGFWSTGNSPIVIDSVFLSNSTDYDPPTAINELSFKVLNENEIVDVYTIMGVRIRSKIKREFATKGLPDGVYIVGKNKVLLINNL
jgi:hypothetical protein